MLRRCDAATMRGVDGAVATYKGEETPAESVSFPAPLIAQQLPPVCAAVEAVIESRHGRTEILSKSGREPQPARAGGSACLRHSFRRARESVPTEPSTAGAKTELS